MNFPGEDVTLLLEKELRVLEKPENLKQYGYENFYKNDKMKKKYACCESYNSKYSALVGKVFKVTAATPYTNIIGTKKYKLQIENPETGTLFFDYSPEYSHSFPFEVIGGLDFPKNFFCKKIDSEVDKFNGEERHRTPYAGGLSLIKTIKDGESDIYLSVNQPGATPNVGKTGLILLLENGDRIERPNAKIDVKVGSGGSYIYSAFISLTDEEIQKLKESGVTDKRLYIYDGEVNSESRFLIQEYLKCLTTEA